MIKKFFYFTLMSISISLVGSLQKEDQEIGDYKKTKILMHGGERTLCTLLSRPNKFFNWWSPEVNSISLAPDGVHLASTAAESFDSNAEHTIKVWNLNTGQCIKTRPSSEKTTALDWSRRGPLAYASYCRYEDDGKYEGYFFRPESHHQVTLWYPFKDACYQFFSYPQEISDLRWSPDGTQLIVCSGSSVDVYTKSNRYAATDANITKEALFLDRTQTLEHEGPVQSASWLSNNELITTCGNKIRTWNSSSADCSAIFEDPDGTIYTAQGSPDGKLIASYSKVVRLLEARTGELLEVVPETCAPLHWLSKNVLALTLTRENPEISDIAEWISRTPILSSQQRRIGTFNLHTRQCHILGGEYDQRIVVGDAPDYDTIISSPSRAQIAVYYENGLFTSLDSSQTDRIAAGCTDGKISVWDLASNLSPEQREQLQQDHTQCFIQ